MTRATCKSICPGVFCIKGILKNLTKFTGKQPVACNFIKKETLAQVFSYESCEEHLFFI